MYCDQLAMHLEFKDGGGAAWRVSLSAATADFHILHAGAKQLLANCWQPGRVVSYMHLIAENLTARQFAQRSLFEQVQSEAKSDCRGEAVDQPARRPLRPAQRRHPAPGRSLYSDETSSYDICDIYGKTCF